MVIAGSRTLLGLLFVGAAALCNEVIVVTTKESGYHNAQRDSEHAQSFEPGEKGKLGRLVRGGQLHGLFSGLERMG
jgi:hypothetical protein